LGSGTIPASTRTNERDNFVANGARPIQNSYLLDGIENKNRILGFDGSSAQTIQPVIDAIQEFKVQTSNFSAEFGQAAGGVVNVTLKSGTNQVHGSAFDFLRNSQFDARPYFQPPGGSTPLLIQNQFGGTVGGPIRKNQTFFFASWQRSRERSSAPQIATVPTQAMQTGDFGARPIFDPSSTMVIPAGSGYVRMPFPNNRIPVSNWDPVGARVAALYPLPNLPGTASNHFYNPTERTDGDQYNVRIDNRFSSRDALFGRVSISNVQNALPEPLPQPANDTVIASPTGQSVAIGYTHLFSPSILNEFRFGFMRTRSQEQTVGPRLFEQIGLQGTFNAAEIHGLPNFSVSGLSALGPTQGVLPIPATGSTNVPIDKWGRVFQFIDSVSWVRNRHTLKMGTEVQLVDGYAHVTSFARPSISFNGVYTQNPQSRGNSGNAYADLLLGLLSSASISTQSTNQIRQWVYQGYIQDDWKVSSKLSLNIGLRYELATPFVEVNDRQANFILDSGPLFGTLVSASNRGNGGLGRALVNTDYNNLAPRFGFAYQATPQTVVRSAFGIFYGRDENLGPAARLTNNPPFFVRTDYVSDQINPIIVLAQGFPSNALDPARVVSPTVISYPGNYPLPYVMQWNFTVQRQLPAKILLEVGYVGSGARRLYYANSPNTPLPGPGVVNARRPFQNVGSILDYGPFANSSYNALVAKAERRFSNGYSFLASYTWGHSLDTLPNYNDKNDPAPQDPFHLHSNWGSSNFDRQQRLVFSHIYEIPLGKGQNRSLNAIVGGWAVSGIMSLQSGQPFTVTLNFDPSNTGVTGHPDRIRNGALPAAQRDPAYWFDVTAFQAPTSFVFGNSGRGILRGPGQFNLDLGMSRTFSLTERFRLQFRGEFFNLTNTPQFDIPAFTVGATNAGVISALVAPERQLQFALRLSF
jgi:hypothetical protein